MTTLDLKELDRLEREATEANWYKASAPHGTLEIISPPLPMPLALVAPRALAEKDVRLILNARNQLRPLLDLVERMGEALDWAANNLLHERAQAQAVAVLADYRRAKGE